MNEFKLPEKWYVKPNNIDEARILASYFNNNKCGFTENYDYVSELHDVLRSGLSYKYGYEKGSVHTEITFEQFKTYILKEEFKVGDYLYFMPDKPNHYAASIGTLALLKGFDRHDGEDAVIVDWIDTPQQQDGLYYAKHFRKATQEEIDAVTKKEYTIEDLSNGKCAVINDGTVEELRLVLKAAFPNQKSQTIGTFKYYRKGDMVSSNWVGNDEKVLVEEQSVQTFLKQINNMENKEIIGYKLIKPEYEKAAIKIANIENEYWEGFKQGNFRKDNDNVICYEDYLRRLKESGVLDLWFEPIYKETSKVFKMQSSSGTFELDVNSKGIYYKPEDAWLRIHDVKALLIKNITTMKYINSSSVTNKEYSVKIDKVDVGCKKDTLISEWEQVYNYYKSLV